ncbi:ShlB/FhaC/HecB family hemolysin secretion/activation protein [Sphingomonas sp. GB1N7]
MAPPAAFAQVGLNQADPSIVVRSLPKPPQPVGEPDTTLLVGPTISSQVSKEELPRVASSILIVGAAEIPRSAFADAIVPYIGRDLTNSDLTKLATEIAAKARSEGYPLANAWVERQIIGDGILRVRLDAGMLSAVRVIGANNALADRILTRALVTGRPVRRDTLERAILLVGDIPGVSVVESRYIHQDGFGILLVTIKRDWFGAYAQIDNRGSTEVGPIRSTVLGSLRGIVQPGDELGLISAQTPFQPSEFFFVRGRYTSPLSAAGTTLSVSGSYGRAHPGASLLPLRVIGESVDGSLGLSMPLIRAQRKSVWATLEVRALRSHQTLLGSDLRDDRLATLTGALNGNSRVGPGVLRGSVALVAGLPVPGVTHEGDLRTSRSDGDARFLTVTYDLEWVAPIASRFSLALSSQAQIASRPLLATMEIGVGGPSFGRGYDYAERTGDDGILGGAELRMNLGRVVRKVIDRAQIYGAVDGGYVGNLRNGSGGGTLLSTAAGLRLGRGRLDGMLEVALPLNQDRFDTKNRQPRISFRLSRVF